MFEKTFCVDGMANTLDPEDLGTHSDGWSISGAVVEDYYEWVNQFEAVHPVFGRVWGDFEGKVYADTEDGFNAFYAVHPPHYWDYGDI